jgi:hypothetical protein
MFRAVLCSSSGGQILLLQYMISSLSVDGCAVRRLKAESAFSRHTIQPSIESDDTGCYDNKICPPEDGRGNARNMSRIIMEYIYIVIE